MREAGVLLPHVERMVLAGMTRNEIARAMAAFIHTSNEDQHAGLLLQDCYEMEAAVRQRLIHDAYLTMAKATVSKDYIQAKRHERLALMLEENNR